MKDYGSKIIGTGVGHPVKEISNAELEKFIDTNDEWIQTRTGIQTRRLANPELGETTGSLSLKAAEAALRDADLSPSDLELIIVGTLTSDTVMPTTANCLQAALGAKRAFGFDLQAACSGWLYALSVADHFIRAGTVKNALVIGAETLSTLMNWRDRSTCVLFGDAAGATILARTEDQNRILATRLYSDGTLKDLLKIPHGYGKVPPYSAEYRLDQHKIQMKGNEIFKIAVRNMVEAATSILFENNLSVKDINLFVFHQANIRIIDLCAKMLEVDPDKMWVNVQKYGNTSAATLPVCLDEARKAGKAKEGDLVLVVTFGGGLTWASGLVRL
jgi:3-oxoacyl-[acyl-carrier-protein] synthase-3